MKSSAFSRSLGLLAGLVAALGWGAWQTSAWAQRETEDALATQRRTRQAEQSAQQAEAAWRQQEAAMPPVRGFLRAWAPHLQPAQPTEQDLAATLRSTLESAAQRKLGLVTDHAVTPEVVAISLQGRAVPVQRVTLRASGESLVALITWLGEAENRFPLARVEHWELTATGGKNTALKLTLAQPLATAWRAESKSSKEKTRHAY